MAALVLAAAPLIVFASTNIGLQSTGVDDHAAAGHYGFVTAFSTIIGMGQACDQTAGGSPPGLPASYRSSSGSPRSSTRSAPASARPGHWHRSPGVLGSS